MSDALNISVSKLTRFEDYVAERWGLDQEKLLLFLKGLEADTYQKGYGSALHSMLEEVAFYGAAIESGQPILIDGFTISNSAAKKAATVANSITSPKATEVWITKKVTLPDGAEVSIRGICDVINAYSIHDYKTTGSKPSYDKYVDSSIQHILYMWMTGLTEFTYHVFWIRDEELGIIEYENYTAFWEPSYEGKILNLIASFYEFIKLNGLVEGWNQTVASTRRQ